MVCGRSSAVPAATAAAAGGGRTRLRAPASRLKGYKCRHAKNLSECVLGGECVWRVPARGWGLANFGWAPARASWGQLRITQERNIPPRHPPSPSNPHPPPRASNPTASSRRLLHHCFRPRLLWGRGGEEGLGDGAVPEPRQVLARAARRGLGGDAAGGGGRRRGAGGLGSGREGPPGEGAAGGRRALPEGACSDRIPILSRCRAQSSSGGSGGSKDARPLPV